MKKGFTLVELAIVLVIIGLIMGMAVKGKSLIETAKIRREISKIKQIGTASATYMARHGGRVPLDKSALISSNIIPPSEFISYFELATPPVGMPELAGTTEYEIYPCYKSTIGNSLLQNGKTDSHVCLSTKVNATYNELTDMPRELICYLEIFLDDENVKDGYGTDAILFNSGNPGGKHSVITPFVWNFSDCKKLPSFGEVYSLLLL